MKVMNPEAEARGLRLARNGKGAACGRMTAARHRRAPAAGAPTGAYIEQCTRATISARDAGMFE
jgi:hypothetical protein